MVSIVRIKINYQSKHLFLKDLARKVNQRKNFIPEILHKLRKKIQN